jgi:hypothetical protein
MIKFGITVGKNTVTANCRYHKQSGNGIDIPLEDGYYELISIWINEEDISDIVTQEFWDEVDKQINEVE